MTVSSTREVQGRLPCSSVRARRPEGGGGFRFRGPVAVLPPEALPPTDPHTYTVPGVGPQMLCKWVIWSNTGAAPLTSNLCAVETGRPEGTPSGHTAFLPPSGRCLDRRRGVCQTSEILRHEPLAPFRAN